MQTMDSTSFTPWVEGASYHFPFSVNEKEMESFASLSGDHNPIHLDDSFAQSTGFKGRVVYGGLIVAAISRLIGREVPGRGGVWHNLSIDFKSPLYLGEMAEVVAVISYANNDLGILRLSFEVKRGEQIIAVGKAQAGIPRKRT